MPDTPLPEQSTREDRFVAVVEQFLLEREAGGEPDPKRYLESFPDLTTQLLDFFAGQDLFDRLAPELAPRGLATVAAACDETPGARFDGFELLEEIGRGGMGVVYRARQQAPQREVALKVLRGDRLRVLPPDEQEQWLERFRREAQLVAAMDRHPHLITLFEVGEHAGQPFFTMELVRGGSLADRLRQARRGLRPNLSELVGLLAKVARAVDHAHRHGVLHRDLKPGNILLDETGEPRVGDFGLARRLDQTASQAPSGVAGTVPYVAPEQARGTCGATTTAADVYSLGAILYELLAGRPPFVGGNDLETLSLILEREPEPPSRHAPGVSRDLETICLKCLGKDPRSRYGSAATLADDLARYLAGQPILARPAGWGERCWKWAKRRPAVAGLLGVIAALTVTSLLLLVLAWRHAERGWSDAVNERQKSDAAAREAQRLRLAAEAGQQAATRAASRYQRLSAGLLLDRGIALAEQQDGARGLLWLTRGLQVTAREDTDLERAFRLNLAAWGEQMHRLRFIAAGKPLRLGDLVFSPDDSELLAWGDDGAHRWDAEGNWLGRLTHPGIIHAAAYSGGGKNRLLIATAGGDGTARVWDARSGKAVGRPLVHPAAVSRLTFSPDGKRLLTACEDDSARLWDLQTGKRVGEPMKHEGIALIAFNPNGKSLLTASARDRKARLWDLTTRPVGKPMKHEAGIVCAAFSPDGKQIATGAVSGDGVRLWDGETGKAVARPLTHNHTVNSLQYLANGLLLSCCKQTVLVWDLTRGEATLALSHPSLVGAIDFSRADGAIATSCLDQSVRLWDHKGNPIGPTLPHQQQVARVAFSKDGKSVATLAGGVVRVWAPRRPAAPARVAVSRFLGAALSPDCRTVALLGGEGRMELLAVAPGGRAAALGKPLPGRFQPYLRPGFSGDGKTLVTGDPLARTLRLWNAANGEPLKATLAIPTAAFSVALSHNGKVILAGGSDSAGLYDVVSRKPSGKLLPHPGTLWAVALSPDGTLAATGGTDGAIRLWNVAGKPLHAPLVHRGVRMLSFSRDGKYLLSGGGLLARLWNVTTGRAAIPPLMHGAQVEAAAISPDGKLLLTGTDYGPVQLWDAATGKPIGPPGVEYHSYGALGFAPDSKSYRVVTASGLYPEVKAPRPLEGTAKHIRLWAEVLTGLELDEDGVIGALDGAAWRERRARLEKLGLPPGRR
jgi:WD40 repeat protein